MLMIESTFSTDYHSIRFHRKEHTYTYFYLTDMEIQLEDLVNGV